MRNTPIRSSNSHIFILSFAKRFLNFKTQYEGFISQGLLYNGISSSSSFGGVPGSVSNSSTPNNDECELNLEGAELKYVVLSHGVASSLSIVVGVRSVDFREHRILGNFREHRMLGNFIGIDQVRPKLFSTRRRSHSENRCEKFGIDARFMSLESS